MFEDFLMIGIDQRVANRSELYSTVNRTYTNNETMDEYDVDPLSDDLQFIQLINKINKEMKDEPI